MKQLRWRQCLHSTPWRQALLDSINSAKVSKCLPYFQLMGLLTAERMNKGQFPIRKDKSALLSHIVCICCVLLNDSKSLCISLKDSLSAMTFLLLLLNNLIWIKKQIVHFAVFIDACFLRPTINSHLSTIQTKSVTISPLSPGNICATLLLVQVLVQECKQSTIEQHLIECNSHYLELVYIISAWYVPPTVAHDSNRRHHKITTKQ